MKLRFLLTFSMVVSSTLLLPSRLAAEGEDNPTGVSGVFNGNVTTAGSYDPHTRNVKRVITDISVPGSVGPTH
jgi:hypothetical protein